MIAPPLVGDRVDLPAPHPHADEEDEVGDERRDGGAHHPVRRDQHDAERDVDERRGAAHDPVELGLAHAADADREHRVARVGGDREAEQRHRVGGAVEVPLRREEVDEPGGERAERERHPAGDEQQVGEHVGVRALGGAVVPDRVGERRPRELERGHQEDDHRGDPDGERVDADLGLALEAVDEEAVDQVDRPERERGRDERQPEAVHRPQQTAVELEAELVAAVGEQDDVDRERAEEVADHRADRALVRRRRRGRSSRRS